MKTKLCSDSQQWTLWFTSNTQGQVGSLFPPPPPTPGRGPRSLSRQITVSPCLPPSSRGPKSAFAAVGGEWIRRMAGSPKQGPFRCFTRGLCCLRRAAPRHPGAHMCRDGGMRHKNQGRTGKRRENKMLMSAETGARVDLAGGMAGLCGI